MTFKTDPEAFIVGNEAERAIRSLECYFKSYTGSRFERFRDKDHPNEFTANDFLAVSMLGVTIPANAAVWLLQDGLTSVRKLLGEIGPADRHIEDPKADLATIGFAMQLWRLVRKHRWPEGEAASGLGRTKASKLLAAKRPHLFPVYDKHVASALLRNPKDDDWKLWQRRFQSADGDPLRHELGLLRSSAGISSEVSDLRIFDIVIWMRVHGYKWSRTLQDFEEAPRFWIGGSNQKR